jgi:hypothetical protein
MTTDYVLGDVIAERQLDAVGQGGREPVVVRIGKPFPDPLSPGRDWCCPYQIVGLGAEAVDAAFGVDSLQAFLLAVYAVQLKLAQRAEEAAVRVEWLEQEDLGLKVDPEVEKMLPPTTRQVHP